MASMFIAMVDNSLPVGLAGARVGGSGADIVAIAVVAGVVVVSTGNGAGADFDSSTGAAVSPGCDKTVRFFDGARVVRMTHSKTSGYRTGTARITEILLLVVL
jgi:hypothetical protein